MTRRSTTTRDAHSTEEQPPKVEAGEAASRRPPAKDLLASLVVFLVALPLCMGIAIASGVPPALGLVTGIVGGLVVGLLAGSPLQVSGPAAGLAVLVLQFVDSYGLHMLGVAVVGAGALQLIAGALRLGSWFRAVSPAVIGGMLAGIGVLIFGSQFHVMVDDTPRGDGLANLLSVPEAIYKGIVPVDGSSHHVAAVVGMLTLITLVLWVRFKPSKVPLPAPLVAVVVATLVAWIVGADIQYVSVPESLIDSLNIPALSDFSMLTDSSFLIAVIGMAAIASAETLLCATAVDRMHDGPRTKYDKELFAQGVGNILCGAVGALPMTGVIVRSSANVEAGGKTRASAFFHGVWLLGLVVAAPFVLRAIPTAALAAILVYTGYRLLNVPGLLKLYKARPGEAAVQLGTLVAIVATDLLTGVLIGLGLALAKLLHKFATLDVELREQDDHVDVFLSGAATFLRLPLLAKHLEAIPMGSSVEVHLGNLSHLDHGCLELLKSWASQRDANGGTTRVDWKVAEARSRNVVVALGDRQASNERGALPAGRSVPSRPPSAAA